MSTEVRPRWPDISPMHELEVWCASTRRWVGGFWFEAVAADGSLLVRRGIDLQVLPTAFPADRVRQAPVPVEDGPRGWGPARRHPTVLVLPPAPVVQLPR